MSVASAQTSSCLQTQGMGIDGQDGEKPSTYRFVEQLSKWCMEHLGVPITVVRKSSKYSSLYDNCESRGELPPLAFGWKTCFIKWKAQPQDRFLNNWPPAKKVWARGDRVLKAIGYHAGEQHRVKLRKDKKYNLWYPLIEWDWDTLDCIEALKRHGLPEPMKSACYFCPASTKKDVKWLAENEPKLMAKALAMEDRAMPSLTHVKGLGRRWSWRTLLETDHPELLPEAPEIACMCFDGDE